MELPVGSNPAPRMLQVNFSRRCTAVPHFEFQDFELRLDHARFHQRGHMSLFERFSALRKQFYQTPIRKSVAGIVRMRYDASGCYIIQEYT
ncbi:hypothetical protein SAMN04488512_102329 [Sulfitobacter litoralis]|uniref:Uncharacterized protein n=1 Tax=Sulfitobacter litoralis TaxID=335975 RepID=A0ABY0RRT0_9RHOB|nr:hypothetical protein SAMN04488512_102329 [Sulfitobacter litoralis]